MERGEIFNTGLVITVLEYLVYARYERKREREREREREPDTERQTDRNLEKDEDKIIT